MNGKDKQVYAVSAPCGGNMEDRMWCQSRTTVNTLLCREPCCLCLQEMGLKTGNLSGGVLKLPSYFFVSVTKHFGKGNLRQRELFWLTVQVCSPYDVEVTVAGAFIPCSTWSRQCGVLGMHSSLSVCTVLESSLGTVPPTPINTGSSPKWF